MSVVPPILAWAGLGAPKAVLRHFPETSPASALMGAIVLYNAPHMVRVLASALSDGVYDNTMPRQQLQDIMSSKDASYEIVQKAQAAHQNGLESFPPFAAGVLAAWFAGVDSATAGKLASLHLLCRAAFNVVYLCPSKKALGVLRSVLWVASLTASCQLIAMAGKKRGGF